MQIYPGYGKWIHLNVVVYLDNLHLGCNLNASKEGRLSALWRWISLSSKERNCNVSVISNVSIFLCLVLFIRKAGRCTSSSLLSGRFRWREKQLRAGLSGHISKLVKDLCCLNNFFVLFRRIKTNIYGNSSKSFLCFGRQYITFVWRYNSDGTFDRAFFRFINGSSSDFIVIKRGINLDATVPKGFYKGCIQENLNATRAEITIFALQRSENGEYGFHVSDSTLDPAINKVTVQVQCK